jgi:hypothetical protein
VGARGVFLRFHLLYYILSFVKLAHSLDLLLPSSSELTHSRSLQVRSIRATLGGTPSFSSLVSIPTGGEGSQLTGPLAVRNLHEMLSEVYLVVYKSPA